MPHPQTLASLRQPTSSRLDRFASENDVGIEEVAKLHSATLNRYEALQIRLDEFLAVH